MKYILLLLIFILPAISVSAQENSKLTRKEKKARREAERKVEIKNVLESKTFVFNATNALPTGGQSVQLGYYFEAEICGDTINSYLPYFGIAYNIDYGSRKSPFEFVGFIDNYAFEKDKNGYNIKFETRNKLDFIKFNFQISELGYATLHVVSTNRQSISFYGTIEKTEDE